MDWRGRAWLARRGEDGHGAARQAKSLQRHGKAQRGWLGRARSGEARLGEARRG